MKTKELPEIIASRLRIEVDAVHPFFKMRQGFRNLDADAAGYWSYPAFLHGGEKSLLWFHLILITVAMPEKQRTALFRPKAIVVTLPDSCTLVRYENLRFGHDPFPSLSWKEPVAMFPHQSVAKLSYHELHGRETSLLAQYREAQTGFLERGELSDSFRDAYLNLIHPIFLPYLRHLAPDFFTALKMERSLA